MSRRRTTRWVLFLLFVVVPLVEIYVLVQVGQVIGAWWTILLLVVDSLVGAWLVRREGGRAWAALRTALSSGRMPATELADAALVLVGGTLLLTPGFLTDVVGFALVLPFTRPVARRLVAAAIARRLAKRGAAQGLLGGMLLGDVGRPAAGPQPPPGRASGHPVVRGEVLRDGDERHG